MKSGVISAAALCVCPPALLMTGAAVSPHIKRAIHKATAPIPMAKRRAHTLAARQTARVPCLRVAQSLPAAVLPPSVAEPAVELPNGVSVTPLATAAGPVAESIPTSFGGGVPAFAPGGLVGGALIPIPGATPPVTTPTNPVTPVTPIPEPAAWALLIVGFGAVGAIVRRRPRLIQQRMALPQSSAWFGASRPYSYRLAAAGTGLLADAVGAAKAGGVAGAMKAAALCVCPVAAVVATATQVPKVRAYVHMVTASTHAPRMIRPVTPLPCDPALRAHSTVTPLSRVAANFVPAPGG